MDTVYPLLTPFRTCRRHGPPFSAVGLYILYTVLWPPYGIGGGAKIESHPYISYRLVYIYFLLPLNVLTCEVSRETIGLACVTPPLCFFPFIFHIIPNPPFSLLVLFQIKKRSQNGAIGLRRMFRKNSSRVSPFINGLMTHLNGMMRIIGIHCMGG